MGFFMTNILVPAGLLVIFASVNLVSGQIPGTGLCPQNLTIEQNFQLDNYMGKWYEYERYPFVFEIGTKCNFAIYTKKDKSLVGVLNASIRVLTNNKSNVTGEAKVIRSGELAVYFRGEAPETPNYVVLSTDYDNYAVVFSCKQMSRFGHTKILWILTRKRIPDESTIQAAIKVITDNNLSTMPLMKTEQSSCPDDTEEIDDMMTVNL